MNGTQLIAYEKQHTQENYPDEQWVEIINLGLDDLTPVAKLLRRKDFIAWTIVNGAPVIYASEDADLAQAHEIVNVWAAESGKSNFKRLDRLEITDDEATGYKIFGDDIYLQAVDDLAGTARVEYYKKFTHVTTGTLGSELEIQSEYTGVLIDFVSYKALERERKDFSKAYMDYINGKAKYALDRIWAMEPQNRGTIRAQRLMAQLGIQPKK